MTLCSVTNAHCCCQPDQGVPCPDRASPSAWIVAIIVIRGDGSKFTLHQKVVFNLAEALGCKKQWPDQLKALWYWPEEQYPGYEVEIVLTPLYR